jgi:CO dehydrogenase/acetyl-CoA synthase beta subunit
MFYLRAAAAAAEEEEEEEEEEEAAAAAAGEGMALLQTNRRAPSAVLRYCGYAVPLQNRNTVSCES